jgi:hypothetical protein
MHHYKVILLVEETPGFFCSYFHQTVAKSKGDALIDILMSYTNTTNLNKVKKTSVSLYDPS